MLTLKIFLPLLVFINYCKSEEIQCGIPDSIVGLIINGSPVSRGAWPWLVALFRAETNKFFCGATLISKQHILTAAHCMQGKYQREKTGPNEIVAYLGRHSLSKPFERGSQIGYPSRILIHPEWNTESVRYDADISLIFLENDVVFGAYVSPICLSDSKTGFIGLTGTVVSAMILE